MKAWALYRFRQGLSSLTATIRPEHLELARRHLSESELAVFERMQPADQKHSIGVLRSLLAAGVSDPSLLRAGLLHDVGKSRVRISVVHRTVAVILRALLGRIPSFLVWNSPDGEPAPFYVLENHPRLSASMLARIGCEERVWRLAELHHADLELIGPVPDEQWVRWALAELKRADTQN